MSGALDWEKADRDQRIHLVARVRALEDGIREHKRTVEREGRVFERGGAAPRVAGHTLRLWRLLGDDTEGADAGGRRHGGRVDG